MAAISIKLDGGQYIGCSNPKESISELIDHYISVNTKNGDKVVGLVINPNGSTMLGYNLLGMG